MRFKHDTPTLWARKRTKKFLWLPLRLKYETRWLEFAEIEYKAKTREDIDYFYWEPVEFVKE